MPDILDQLEKLLAQQRADERRKNATTDRARWDRTLDNLENTLAE